MKNQLISLMIFVLAFTSGFAQKQDKIAETAVHKGENTINLYYGFSLANRVYKYLATADAIALSFKSVGPVGVVYEHMVTDKLGLGVELGYSKFIMRYDETLYSSSSKKLETYSDEWQITQTRAMMRLNIHLLEEKKVDCYFLLSAGYRNWKYTFTTTDPTGSVGVAFKTPLAFGFKPGIGVRYFFNRHIGLNTEVALGSPVLSGGATIKF